MTDDRNGKRYDRCKIKTLTNQRYKKYQWCYAYFCKHSLWHRAWEATGSLKRGKAIENTEWRSKTKLCRVDFKKLIWKNFLFKRNWIILLQVIYRLSFTNNAYGGGANYSNKKQAKMAKTKKERLKFKK